MSPVPVLILAGFLGSGKTTLLRRILLTNHGKKVLVVQNEFTEKMGIESPILTDAAGNLIGDMYELPNGCMCCSSRAEFLLLLEKVIRARAHEFDFVVVEASGVADVGKLVEALWSDGSRTRAAGVVVVVDAGNIQRFLSLTEDEVAKVVTGDAGVGKDCDSEMLEKALRLPETAVEDKNGEWTTSTSGTVAEMAEALSSRLEDSRFSLEKALLKERYEGLSALSLEAAKQIAWGDVVLINKVDLLKGQSDAESTLNDIENVLVRKLNPTCSVFRTTKCDVDLAILFSLCEYPANTSTEEGQQQKPVEELCIGGRMMMMMQTGFLQNLTQLPAEEKVAPHCKAPGNERGCSAISAISNCLLELPILFISRDGSPLNCSATSWEEGGSVVCSAIAEAVSFSDGASETSLKIPSRLELERWAGRLLWSEKDGASKGFFGALYRIKGILFARVSHSELTEDTDYDGCWRLPVSTRLLESGERELNNNDDSESVVSFHLQGVGDTYELTPFNAKAFADFLSRRAAKGDLNAEVSNAVCCKVLVVGFELERSKLLRALHELYGLK